MLRLPLPFPRRGAQASGQGLDRPMQGRDAARQVAVFDRGPAVSGDHLADCALVGPIADRLDEIVVGGLVGGEGLRKIFEDML